MSEMTRRGFLKGAAAAGAAATGATAGCLSRQTECSEEDMLDVADEQYAVDDVDEDMEFVMNQIRGVQSNWAELANERVGERTYGGPMYDPENITVELYGGNTLDPDGAGSESERYDVLCRMKTHPGGVYEDIAGFIEDNPEEAELGLASGLETLIAASIELPAVRQQESDVEDPERYKQFQDNTAGIRAQLVDQQGSYMDVYVPEETMNRYVEMREQVNDPRGIYREARHYVSDNMEHHVCEENMLGY